jgi:hypothetical protein
MAAKPEDVSLALIAKYGQEAAIVIADKDRIIAEQAAVIERGDADVVRILSDNAALLAPWVEAVKKVTPWFEKYMMVIPTQGDIQMLQELTALLSAPSAAGPGGRDDEFR